MPAIPARRDHGYFLSRILADSWREITRYFWPPVATPIIRFSQEDGKSGGGQSTKEKNHSAWRAQGVA